MTSRWGKYETFAREIEIELQILHELGKSGAIIQHTHKLQSNKVRENLEITYTAKASHQPYDLAHMVPPLPLYYKIAWYIIRMGGRVDERARAHYKNRKSQVFPTVAE